jgi:hypothetical protein
MKKGIFFFILLISVYCIPNYSCKRKNSRLKVDVSKIEVKINIKRYEKDLFSLEPNDFYKGIISLEGKYPFFLKGIRNDSFALARLHNFTVDPLSIQLYLDSQKKYSKLDDIETSLSEALKHYKYYFSEATIPEVYTYISGLEFKYPIKFSNDVLVISLDMYLGSNYKSYKDIGLPAYKTYKYRKESIVPDCMKEIAITYLPQNKDNTFLSDMVEAGKIIYFTEAMMPDLPDSLKIDFTKLQLEWCQSNEAKVWAYLIDNNLLYSTDKAICNKFLCDAPYSVIFPKPSPSRVAVWTGWQIIRKYMDAYPKISLKDLMADNDAQKILMKSKYKPRK